MIDGSIPEGLTFDDVLLAAGAQRGACPPTPIPRRSSPAPIALNIPIVSAAMDTVTESHLAIALAQQGGIGIIHRNMSIERQAEEVDRVKRSESGMIVDPITIAPDQEDLRRPGGDETLPHLGRSGDRGRAAGGHSDQPRPALRDRAPICRSPR